MSWSISILAVADEAEPVNVERLAVVVVMAFDAIGAATPLACQRPRDLSSLECPGEGVSSHRLLRVPPAALRLVAKGGLAAPWTSASPVVVGAVVVQSLVVVALDIRFRALLALAEMAIGHHRVPVEVREWLPLLALEARLHHRTALSDAKEMIAEMRRPNGMESSDTLGLADFTALAIALSRIS